jgi:ribulose-5-phosphate 4-epimerase/fuculose-1-phosphate aldolase
VRDRHSQVLRRPGHPPLYRRDDLRAVVEEHRARSQDASTLTGLAVQIDQLRHGLEAVAAKVDDDIGRGIVATLTGHRSPAVLMRGHGVFVIGRTAAAAVKAAVMCEDAAHMVHLARAYGTLERIPEQQIDALHQRYKEHYGQRSPACWSVAGEPV